MKSLPLLALLTLTMPRPAAAGMSGIAVEAVPVMAVGSAVGVIQNRETFSAQVLQVLSIGPSLTQHPDFLSLKASLLTPESSLDTRKQAVMSLLKTMEQALLRSDEALLRKTLLDLAVALELTPEQAKAVFQRYLARNGAVVESMPPLDAAQALPSLESAASYKELSGLSGLETSEQFNEAFDNAAPGASLAGAVTAGQVNLSRDVQARAGSQQRLSDPAVPPLSAEEREEAKLDQDSLRKEEYYKILTGFGFPVNFFTAEWAKNGLYQVQDGRIVRERAMTSVGVLQALTKEDTQESAAQKDGQRALAVKLMAEYKTIAVFRGKDDKTFQERLTQWQAKADTYLATTQYSFKKEEKSLREAYAGKMTGAREVSNAFESDPEVQDILKKDPAAAELLAKFSKGEALTDSERQALGVFYRSLSGTKSYEKVQEAFKALEAAGENLDGFYAKHPELKAYYAKLSEAQAFNLKALQAGLVLPGRIYSPIELGLELPPGTRITVAKEKGKLGYWVMPPAGSEEDAWFKSLDGSLVLRYGKDKQGKIVNLIQQLGDNGLPAFETLTDAAGKDLLKTEFRRDGSRTIEDFAAKTRTWVGADSKGETSATIEDMAGKVVYEGKWVDGSIRIEKARLQGTDHQPLYDKSGKLIGARLNVPKRGWPDLKSLVGLGLLKQYQVTEFTDILLRQFPAGLSDGQTFLQIGPDGQPHIYHETTVGGGRNTYTLFYQSGGLVFHRQYRFANGDTSEKLEIYRSYSKQGRGGGEHWGSIEVYDTAYVNRYSVERDWHTSKEFSYGKWGWNGKSWNLVSSKVPESDGAWSWVTSRISWTFQNAPVYKQVGTAVGFAADRGKDFGYLISGYTGKLIGATGSVDHKVYGIVTKWQAPILANRAGAGLSLLEELKNSLTKEDYETFMADWRERYRKEHFDRVRDIATAFAIKDRRTDISDEELGKFINGGGAGVGFGGAGREFSSRAADSAGLAKVGNFTAAAMVYAGDFTFQSLGFNAIGSIANVSAKMAQATTASGLMKTGNFLFQGARFTQDAYFISLMGVQGIELGEALSKGDKVKATNSLAQVAGLFLMPGGNGERQAKTKIWGVSFKAMGKEMVTTGFLAGAVFKAGDVVSAGKTEGLRGAAYELGYNPYAKSGKLYAGTSEAMVETARDLGKNDPILAKELADTAAKLDGAPAEKVQALALELEAKGAHGKAAETAQAMKTEAEIKLERQAVKDLYENLKKIELDALSMSNILDQVQLPELRTPRWLKSLIEKKAVQMEGLTIKDGASTGEAAYTARSVQKTRKPAPVEVKAENGAMTVKHKGAKADLGEIVQNGNGFVFKRKGQEGVPGEWALVDGRWQFKTADGKFSLKLQKNAGIVDRGLALQALKGTPKIAKTDKVVELPNGVRVVKDTKGGSAYKVLFPKDWTLKKTNKAAEAVVRNGKVAKTIDDMAVIRGEHEGVTLDVVVGKDGKVISARPAPLFRYRFTESGRVEVRGKTENRGLERKQTGMKERAEESKSKDRLIERAREEVPVRRSSGGPRLGIPRAVVPVRQQELNAPILQLPVQAEASADSQEEAAQVRETAATPAEMGYGAARDGQAAPKTDRNTQSAPERGARNIGAGTSNEAAGGSGSSSSPAQQSAGSAGSGSSGAGAGGSGGGASSGGGFSGREGSSAAEPQSSSFDGPAAQPAAQAAEAVQPALASAAHAGAPSVPAAETTPKKSFSNLQKRFDNSPVRPTEVLAPSRRTSGSRMNYRFEPSNLDIVGMELKEREAFRELPAAPVNPLQAAMIPSASASSRREITPFEERRPRLYLPNVPFRGETHKETESDMLATILLIAAAGGAAGWFFLTKSARPAPAPEPVRYDFNGILG